MSACVRACMRACIRKSEIARITDILYTSYAFLHNSIFNNRTTIKTNCFLCLLLTIINQMISLYFNILHLFMTISRDTVPASPRILVKLGLFDAFLRETKDLAKKCGGLPREASYYSLKSTTIEIRKPVISTKNSNMYMLSDHLRMLCDHLRMLCSHIMHRRTMRNLKFICLSYFTL